MLDFQSLDLPLWYTEKTRCCESLAIEYPALRDLGKYCVMASLVSLVVVVGLDVNVDQSWHPM